jgi:hypothetical protein
MPLPRLSSPPDVDQPVGAKMANVTVAAARERCHPSWSGMTYRSLGGIQESASVWKESRSQRRAADQIASRAGAERQGTKPVFVAPKGVVLSPGLDRAARAWRKRPNESSLEPNRKQATRRSNGELGSVARPAHEHCIGVEVGDLLGASFSQPLDPDARPTIGGGAADGERAAIRRHSYAADVYAGYPKRHVHGGCAGI